MKCHHDTTEQQTIQVEGILTRKDLMGFAIEEKLERLLRHPHRKLSRSVVLALRKNYGQKMKKRPSSDAAANANPESSNEKFVGFGDVTQGGGGDSPDGNGNNGSGSGGDPETGIIGETTRCLNNSVDGGDVGVRKDSGGGSQAGNSVSDSVTEPNGGAVFGSNTATTSENHNHVI